MGFRGAGAQYKHRQGVSYKSFNKYQQDGKGMADSDGAPRQRGLTAVTNGSDDRLRHGRGCAAPESSRLKRARRWLGGMGSWQGEAGGYVRQR